MADNWWLIGSVHVGNTKKEEIVDLALNYNLWDQELKICEGEGIHEVCGVDVETKVHWSTITFEFEEFKVGSSAMRGCCEIVEFLKALCIKYPKARFSDVMVQGMDYDWYLLRNKDGKLWVNQLQLMVYPSGVEYENDESFCRDNSKDTVIDIIDL